MTGRIPQRALASARYRLTTWKVSHSSYRLFAVGGGSGSSHLLHMLDRTGRAFHRPDTGWTPPVLGAPATELLPDLRVRYPSHAESDLLMDSYDFDTVVDSYGTFTTRTNNQVKVDPSLTIEKNLAHLCQWAHDEEHFVAFNNAAIMKLFSRCAIPDVVFLVRHPRDAYLSLTAPERHPELADAFGGVDAPRSIEIRCDHWNRRVDEYLRCRDEGLNPVLIRYESAREDADVSKDLATIFNDHRPSSKKRPCSYGTDSLIKELTKDRYFEIYKDW